MEISKEVQIIIVERLNEGLVIKFLDGKCAFYSAMLLYDPYVQAEKVEETEALW